MKTDEQLLVSIENIIKVLDGLLYYTGHINENNRGVYSEMRMYLDRAKEHFNELRKTDE